MKNKKRDRWLTGICVLICAVCLGYLGYYYAERDQEKETAEEVTEYRKEEPVKQEEPQEEQEQEEIPIDFTGLQEVNPDIYAWIEVPGTNIKEPVLQSPTDDTYYLNHLYDKSESPYGAVFTERLNKKTFEDFNTVVYGHNTKTVTAFHDLHQFSEEEFFKAHDEVVIYTEKSKKVYRIFAAVEYDNRHILYHYNNEIPAEREEFLQSLKESRSMKNQFREEIKVDESSHIITLSTCIKGKPDKRWIVEAVEIDE